MSKNDYQVKSLGDGILGIFSMSQASDIYRPLVAASEVMCAFERANVNLPEDEKIMSRVGMACGTVVDFSSFDPHGEVVTDPQGPVVDLAARLCSLAGPQQILCDRNVYEAAKGGTFRFSESEFRMVKGFDTPVEVFAMGWDPSTEPKVAYSAPMYVPGGFFVPKFVLSCARRSRRILRITGLTHRYYCDNFELYNIVANKCALDPKYKLVLVFLNPKSEFMPYARLISRRGSGDLGTLVLQNLAKACKCYQGLERNVEIICSDYPIMIPLVQEDSFVHFSLPFRAQRRNGEIYGIANGPCFSVSTDSTLGSMIQRNVLMDRIISVPIRDVANGKVNVNEIIEEASDLRSGGFGISGEPRQNT